MQLITTLYYFEHYIFLLKEKTLQKVLKTIRNIDIKYRIAYFRILFFLFFFEKWKMGNQKLGHLGNLWNIIPIFLMSEFSMLPNIQNWKLRFKKKWKKISEIFEFSTWPDLGALATVYCQPNLVWYINS